MSTFASVRSANRAARAAEEALAVGLQPLLVPSRLQDDRQKIFFIAGWLGWDTTGTGTGPIPGSPRQQPS
jgi:hypothetical protein